MAQHVTGVFGGYTTRHKPLELVFSQEFETRKEALSAEPQIKGWTRRKKEALIK